MDHCEDQAMEIYCDASRPHHNSKEPPVYSLVAHVATSANWKRARKEWRIELGKKGVDFFHMKDFMYAKRLLEHGKPIPESNPFVRFGQDEFDSFFLRLSNVINRVSDGKRRLTTRACSVLREDFEKTRPEALQYDVRCINAFVFNIYILLMQMAKWADETQYNGKFLYCFDDGDEGSGRVHDLFRYIAKRDDLRKYFRLHWKPAESYDRTVVMAKEPAIQMADIGAYIDRENLLQWYELGMPEFIPRSERSDYMDMLYRRGELRGVTYRQKELIDEFHTMMLYGIWKLK